MIVDSHVIDPITFEVLRHRLTAIIEEGALVMLNTSGSPMIAYSNDCNVIILDAEGNAVQMGFTLPTHSISCINLVRYVLREFRDNPGIDTDDMFLSNDPYNCTPHQNCAVMAAPVFHDGELIAWVGSGIHFDDMGGPTEGQAAIGANSIYDEPPFLPPVKIIERGTSRKDLEEVFLHRSRTRAQNTLDYKAMMASNNTMRRRLVENLDRYGPEKIKAMLAGVLNLTEERVRSTLRELPDGVWAQELHMDYFSGGQTRLYTCKVLMTKVDDRLEFDFTGSSPQAPAVINCTRSSLETSVMIPLVSIFGFAISPCPSALMRPVEIISEPGTIVHCTWPAGVSKGTTSMSLTIRHAVTLCMSKLFAAAPSYQQHVRAVCNGHRANQAFSGTDQRGDRFSGSFIDLLGGFGASAILDGIDSGGPIEGPDRTIPNVENNELYFPFLYLYRREEVDTAGPGEFRGGAGLAAALTPHDVDEIGTFVVHSIGVEVPTALGIDGGAPGSLVHIDIIKGTDVPDLFARGVLPTSSDEMGGALEPVPGMHRSSLRHGDVFICASCGGGGYGDPIARDPQRVLRDVLDGLVSPSLARDVYGVVFVDGELNDRATVDRRIELRSHRQHADGLTARSSASTAIDRDSPHRLGEIVRCQCQVDGSGRGDAPLVTRDRSCAAQPPYGRSDPRFLLRETFCSRCWSCVDVQLVDGLETDAVNVTRS